MATIVTREKHLASTSASDSDVSTRLVNPLGAPIENKQFWFQRGRNYEPNAVATQVCLVPR